MIFLFEDFYYNTEYLGSVIPLDTEMSFNTVEGKTGTRINGVGYCFYNNHTVFVLPKVFVHKNGGTFEAFGEEISLNGEDVFGNVRKKISESEPARQFLSGLGLWLYSAIQKYNDHSDKEKNGVKVLERRETQKFKKSERHATLPDIMSSMEMFFKKNQNLFVFVAKSKSSGNHKVDWHKTISRKQAFWQNGVPIYMETVRKAKAFDLDDRLLVLYFSTMNYIQSVYGCRMPKSEFYQPLKVNEVQRLMEDERGVRELRRIKYKYFDDRLLKLYNIVEAFFRWGAEFARKDSKAKEYLIVNSFNNVFEAMIDELIGDPDSNIQKLKHNDDGKIIDHLYKERSLIFASENDSSNNKIWHIGDSKYYKEERDLETKSIAKQFTYAKNLIQDFFSPKYFDNSNGTHEPKPIHKGIHYRDELTEGYSVTPNFFIRGYMPLPKDRGGNDVFDQFSFDDRFGYLRQNKTDDGHSYTDKLIDYDEGVNGAKSITDSDDKTGAKKSLWDIRNRHFENRLFDRDTLLLQVYNVNFLYVLKAYTSPRSSLHDEFKNAARKMFREKFLKLLDDKYVFWAVRPQSGNLSEFVEAHFKLLAGKIFRRNELDDFVILALEKENPENKLILEKVRESADFTWLAVEQFVDESEDANCLKVTNGDDGLWDEDYPGFMMKHEIFEEKIMNGTILHKWIKVHFVDGHEESFLLHGGVVPKYSATVYHDIDGYFLPCKSTR